jgi:predicted SAM-dependent methyltransferase
MNVPLVLHAGCANSALKDSDPDYYKFEFQEDRLDIDPKLQCTIVGSVTDIPTDSDKYDIVHCYHMMEHLSPKEVPQALSEFLRVLKPGGELRVMVPDLESVCSLVLSRGLESAIYVANVGPITPRDMLYGHAGMIEAGFFGMAHKTGFTRASMNRFLKAAGFDRITVTRREVDLKARAFKKSCE